MKCEVIRDLIPLYIDGCCSAESAKAVEEHMKSCESCRALRESMGTPFIEIAASDTPMQMRKINHWKASIMQSVLLFLSFAAITVGVALEARTPVGLMNGFWAANLVIPATGLLLSLPSWYFVNVYKSRKAFSNCALLATLGITVSAYLWAVLHYDVHVSALFAGRALGEVWEIIQAALYLNGLGIFLTVVFCVASKMLSNQFAKMMGKE